MAVPFVDLKKQYAAIRSEVLAAIGEVLDSQVCVLGPQQKALEASVAEYCRCREAVACSSGTDCSSGNNSRRRSTPNSSPASFAASLRPSE